MSPSPRGLTPSPGRAREGWGPWADSAFFLALHLRILLPGAKNGRQALRSQTPALSHPGPIRERVKSSWPAWIALLKEKSTLSNKGEGQKHLAALSVLD